MLSAAGVQTCSAATLCAVAGRGTPHRESAMVAAAFKQVHHATGVNDCVVAYLLSPIGGEGNGFDPTELELYGPDATNQGPAQPNVPQLVVAKGNVLEIFHVLVESEGQLKDLERAAQQEATRIDSENGINGVTSAKLELALRKSFMGTLVSLSVLRRHSGTARSTRDALVLAFETAKVTVLEYDPDGNDLRISSLHSFEGEELRAGRLQYVQPTILRGDPKGRCVAALVQGTHIAVLRAENDMFDDADDGEEDEGEDEDAQGRIIGAAIVASSYTIQLSALGIKAVRDIAFLYGYAEPVLAILHEELPTWAGRYSLRKDTCALSAISLNLEQQMHATIWTTTSLPSDSFRLTPALRPLGGGALVLASSTVWFVAQTGKCFVPSNEKGKVEHQAASAQPDRVGEAQTHDNDQTEQQSANTKTLVSLDLACSRVVFLCPDRGLLFTRDGSLAIIHLHHASGSSHVTSLSLSRAGSSVIASSACTIGTTPLFFIASRFGDSLLVQFTGKTKVDASGEPSIQPAKKLKLEDCDTLHGGSDDELEADLDDEELMLYGQGMSKESSHSKGHSLNTDSSLSVFRPEIAHDDVVAFTFLVRDSMTNVAPIVDFHMMQGVPTTGDNNQASGQQDVLALCGHRKNGSLAVLHESVRPASVIEVEFRDCTKMWAVYHEQSGTEEEPARLARDLPTHSYLILSGSSNSRILATGEELEEVSDVHDAFVSGPTVAAGNVLGEGPSSAVLA
eukprot:scaffold3586_cov404-Prasinococcus_capsulatus_cf.AAC.5